VLCAANIHGQEYIGGCVALGLLRALAGGLGAYGSLLNLAEVWIIPCLNPDGYARTFDRGGVGRVVELRTNARGVDLNRNFPLPHGARPSRIPGTGSNRLGAITYRGPTGLSEPETRCLDVLISEQQFRSVLSLHCFMGTVIPARTTVPGEFSVYRQLCRQFALAQPRWKYRRLASRRFDVFTGELEDHAHHRHRAWSACVEVFPFFHSLRQHLLAPSVFWRFNPRNPGAYVENDVPGLVAFFLKALACPPPGEP
jgi:predicted deacylase